MSNSRLARKKLRQQKFNIEKMQSDIDDSSPSIPENRHGALHISQGAKRAISVFDVIFISLLGAPTLNNHQGDKQILKNIYSGLIEALATQVHESQDDSSLNIFSDQNTMTLATHQQHYQCILLTKRPQQLEKLNVGYFLFKERRTPEVEQIYVTIVHPNALPIETMNLSESFSARKLQPFLNLPWPPQGQIGVNYELDKNLKQCLATLSQHNKTQICHYDIFLREAMSEKFCKYLSEEARKEQTIYGEKYRAIVVENGVLANVFSFFGNGLGSLWYLRSGKPRRFGYDTVINQTQEEREHGHREDEISLILSTIKSRFIQEHIDEISHCVREDVQQGIRPK